MFIYFFFVCLALVLCPTVQLQPIRLEPSTTVVSVAFVFSWCLSLLPFFLGGGGGRGVLWEEGGGMQTE